ncbi:hypothetical protein MTR67_018676 [Solanum verrucosum]|uniref:Uncharacterized protein n=1 Tax=Solanum verrucosum TaxID=315347 RepID=A0AAF0QL42_SOLVR|nr:hypothetical protein MTR67_018676 [Solanum verrucosum]
MANVVANALNRLSMGSVAHAEEERKELAKDAYRLSRLEVKEKQDSDPILLKLKGIVHQHKVEVFSQGGDGVLRY